MAEAKIHFDVLIIGGGLAGLALAARLRGLLVAVIDRQPLPTSRPAAETWDARIYAISPANRKFLTEINTWPMLDLSRLCPVQSMCIRGDAGGQLAFTAYESGVEALAWIIEAGHLQRMLGEACRCQNVTFFTPAQPQALLRESAPMRVRLADGRLISAELIVAADGAHSWMREAAGLSLWSRSYAHSGVVANFACTHPHHDTAYQWFLPAGDVLAWLPLPANRISMVWSTPEAHAHDLLALSSQALAERVAQAGQYTLGTLRMLTPAAAFPLRLARAHRWVAPGLALIGDAAHSIHPLSGHGINLGFQDARVLADVLNNRPTHIPLGDVGLLRRYERARKEEVLALQSATDGLQRLFAARHPLWRVLRNFGLGMTQSSSVLRTVLARYAMDGFS